MVVRNSLRTRRAAARSGSTGCSRSVHGTLGTGLLAEDHQQVRGGGLAVGLRGLLQEVPGLGHEAFGLLAVAAVPLGERCRQSLFGYLSHAAILFHQVLTRSVRGLRGAACFMSSGG